jgi:hypothetical protein
MWSLLRMILSDPGSVNLGRRRDCLPAGSFVYANSFDDIAHQFALCREHRLGPSIAIYEPGFLRAVVAYQVAGALPDRCFAKVYLGSDRGLYGAPFGLPTTVTALAAYLELVAGTGLVGAVAAVGTIWAARTSAAPPSRPAVTCTSGWSSTEASGRRRTSSSGRRPPTPAPAVAYGDETAALLGLARKGVAG